MPKFEVLRHITRNQKAHEIGSEIELTAEEAATLPVRAKVAPPVRKAEGADAEEADAEKPARAKK